MIKFRALMSAVIVTSVTFLLSGCQFALLNPMGFVASEEKNILLLSVALMLIVVIPVVVMTLVFAWRYRASNTKATYQPEWAHSTVLEIIWWTIPCIIIGILSTITWLSSHQLDPYKPIVKADKTPITIQAVALEWKWLFIYPDQAIATVNYVQFPVDVPVKFVITSEGPMNSFQIPQLAGQIYAMSGMQTKLHVLANKTGDFNGFSANFSGEGFTGMKFIAHVGTEAEFTNWVDTVRLSSAALTLNKYAELAKPSMNSAVQYYSAPSTDLFASVVMKYMTPETNPSYLNNKNINVVSK